jgi:hypothetical protein
MNKVALIVSKVLLWAVFLTNIAVVSVVLFLKLNSNSDFDPESSMLDAAGFAVVIVLYITIALQIFGLIVCSILCSLSRKKWLAVAGIVFSLLAATFAGYFALRFALFKLTIFATCYTVLSVGAALLTYFSLRRLASGYENKPALMKPIGLILAGILVIAGVWLTDEPLDSNFHRFYTDNHKTILEKENAAVGLSGLNAPAGSNFMEVGLTAFKKAQVDEALKQNNDVPALPVTKNKIAFVGSNEELYCWVGLPDSIDVWSKCASEKRLNEILRANTVLLSRYWQVAHMPHFRGAYPNGDLFLKINRLIAAEVQLKLRHGRYEDAYQEWRENHRFINRMIGEDSDWIAKAIFTVTDSFSLASAEALIHSYNGIARVHGDELMAMLEPSGLARWNLPATVRAEYDVWLPFFSTFYNSQFWVHPNFIRNTWLHSEQAFLEAAKAPPSLVNEKMQGVSLKYGGFRSWSNDYLRDPLNTVLVRGYLLGTHRFNGVELIRSMHIHDARQRALTLALLIKRRSLKDNEIADFLAKADPELKNPFTGNPMTWEPKKRAIRFVVPKANDTSDDVNTDVRL